MNKEVAYREIVINNKQSMHYNLGKYLDIVKNKWFNKIKEM
jgi:hypothetical protein